MLNLNIEISFYLGKMCGLIGSKPSKTFAYCHLFKGKNPRASIKPKKYVIVTLWLGLVAQLVEQRIENPCVGGSIPPKATIQM